jgi:Mlc titration factor MtfA (ptsG expression regulator)
MSKFNLRLEDLSYNELADLENKIRQLKQQKSFTHIYSIEVTPQKMVTLGD